MTTATHDDIVRLFPGIQDHTVLDIQAMDATTGDLEAALLLLQGDDEGLIDVKRRKADRLNLLIGILENSEVQVRDNADR
jgi:hypothetical protein